MRRVTALAAATLLLIGLLPLTAGAAVVDAAGFAADCNADSQVDVSGTLRVVGGTGSITATECIVVIADGSRLVFRDATLGCDTACSLIVGGSGEGSSIRVVRSIIDVTGFLQLSAGCCSGGELPESRGTVRVIDSALTADSVEVSASVATYDGTVVVRGSKLTGTGPLGVAVATFSNGRTTVVDTTFNSAGDIRIASGFGVTGVTRARRNEFNTSGTVTITAGGGSCVSTGNNPPVPCS